MFLFINETIKKIQNRLRHEEREKKNKKIDNKGAPNIQLCYCFDIIRKISKRRIQWHQERLLMVIQVCHIWCPKVSGNSLAFSDKCNPLNSSLVTFIGVVGLILSRSFWWYQWYRNQSFNVCPSLFFLSSLSFYVIVLVY